MGTRLRLGLVIAAVLLLASPALAEEFSSCWVAKEFNPLFSEYETVTRCRIAGGETVDYASDNDVPDVLYPNLGTDLTGQCWYLTSATTQYVIITQFADGSAEIGFDTDPSDPGAIVAIGPVVPRCTAEPAPATDPSADAWEYVMSYVHAPPTPDLSPSPGEGITGLETFVGVSVPTDHSATIASGLSTIEVEIEVDAVVVDWGDGRIDIYPPTDDILAGYPNGAATHTYEVKTDDSSSIAVGYDWTARWRLVGGSWTALPVPNTSTAIAYPVAEVVSRLTD